MIKRILFSLFVALVVGLGTVRLWQSLRQHDVDQIARIAESESYAARSQLIRNLEAVLSSLEMVRTYWSTVSQLSSERGPKEAGLDADNFIGVSLILWEDPVLGSRFLRDESRPDFRHEPDADEWQRHRALLTRAKKAGANTLAGPFNDTQDRPYFEVYLAGAHSSSRGVLAASIDARALLNRLLLDESPGYSVQVYWGDVLLFQRGEASDGLPPSWRREGFVKTSTGTLWRIVHVPGPEFPENLASPAIDVLLALGLVIAVLMAILTFENWRAHSRASAAEVAERRLAELNRNLETEIANRTRELANRTSDLQTITDSVAHDLRNPLNVIGVNMHLFEAKFKDALTPESAAVLHRITPAVHQMADILDRMLGLSRVAHATFQPETLDMKALVTGIFEDLAATEPPPPVQFEVAELPDALGDRKLVKMLLMNLIGNALKYTRQKDPRRVCVGFEHTAHGGTYRIADNGIGFDSHSADRLFEAFERMTDRNQTEGIGLGLTIAARVVGRHRGRIWATGKPGEGAAFFFTLEPAPPEAGAGSTLHPTGLDPIRS